MKTGIEISCRWMLEYEKIEPFLINIIKECDEGSILNLHGLYSFVQFASEYEKAQQSCKRTFNG